MAVETMTETAALYARQEDRLNPVLEMRGISQIFPGVKALDNVDALVSDQCFGRVVNRGDPPALGDLFRIRTRA